MISVEEALARVLALATPLPGEVVPIGSAVGRSMLEPATALRDQPPFAASAMDGYAVGDPVHPGDSFHVAGISAAGHGFDGTVGPGQAVRIFTGAPLPLGATRVVIQEDVVVSGNTIAVRSTEDRTNVRGAGQDFRAGDSIGPRRLRPNDLALLAAMNVPAVTVARRPVVALIPTGDELVMPGEVPRQDQIIASNIFALKALAEAEGAEVRILPIARDTEAALAAVIDLARDADLIVTIGGASVGDHDLVAGVTEKLGMERAFYRIAMRPGKPLMAGKIDGRAMLGLPGNPVSSIVCCHLFMLPIIRAMQSLPPANTIRRARLIEPVEPTQSRAHYMRAELIQGDGLPSIRALPRQDSALLAVLSEADALLIRPANDTARQAGTEVDYLPL